MEKYTKEYCPHCGHTYQKYSSSTEILTVSREGSPIVTCRHCHKQFIDKRRREQAFSDPPKKLNLFQILLAPFFPFGVYTVILFAIFGIGSGMKYAWVALFPFAFYVSLVCVGIKKKQEIYSDQVRDYKASKKRCSNPNYIIQLIDLGYDVPDWFITTYHPDLLDYYRKKQDERKRSILKRW